MRRKLFVSSAFSRAVKRLGKKDQTVITAIRDTMVLLENDAFDPQLGSHKLKGDLAGLWSCSAGYDLRIVFEITKQGDAEAILLVSCGTHDEVY
jgi:mRNA interferase YafQ